MRRYQESLLEPGSNAEKDASQSPSGVPSVGRGAPKVLAPSADPGTALRAPTQSTPTIDILLRYGALVDARDGHSRTPLHWAAWKDKGDSASSLLLHGASPLIQDNDGRLPIHLASIAGSLMVRYRSSSAARLCVFLPCSAAATTTTDHDFRCRF